MADRIPRPEDASSGIFKDLYRIATAAGRPASAAAASLAAYLVGVLSVQATQSLMPRLRALRRRRWVGDRLRPGAAKPSAAGRQALREAVLDQLADRAETDENLRTLLEQTGAECGESRGVGNRDARRGLLDVRINIDYYAKNLEQDLPLMPLRLLGDEKERGIYGEFDRIRAEAEFRAAVAVPLAALVAVLGVRSSLWWLLALAMPALLLVEAQHGSTAAADVLAESVRARPAQSAALGEVREGPLQYRQNWLEYAAGHDYPGALAAQARALETSGDIAAAERLYRKAAQLGDAAAMMRLAGRLHLRHDAEAELWYEKAEQAGEPAAMTIKEVRGELTPAELSDLRAAHAGEATAMTRIGHYFEERGKTDSAADWYRRARAAGDSDAQAAWTALLRKNNIEATSEIAARTRG